MRSGGKRASIVPTAPMLRQSARHVSVRGRPLGNTTETTPMDALDRKLNHFSNLIALALPPAVAVAVLLDAAFVVALTCVVLFGGLLLGQRRRLAQHRTPPGLANLLTLFRLLLLLRFPGCVAVVFAAAWRWWRWW